MTTYVEVPGSKAVPVDDDLAAAMRVIAREAVAEVMAQNARVEPVQRWAVVDRWWTDDPGRREYLELRIDGDPVVLVREGEKWEVTSL